MDWDEGPEVGGPARPLFPVAAGRALPQGGRRAGRLRPRLSRLQHRGRARRREGRGRDRQASPTASAASRVTDDDRARFEAEGRPFALRFQVPLGPDARRPRPDQGGRRAEDRRDRRLRDRPARRHRRSTTSPASSTTSAMEITHVVRAEEHLSNTFSQLLVFEALGLRAAGLRPRPVRGRAGLEEEALEAGELREARHLRLPARVPREGLSARGDDELPGPARLEPRRAARRSSPAPS